MRNLFLAAALIGAAVPAIAYAADAPKYSSASTINDLMTNPEAKAVLEKRMPQIVQYASQIGGQTLKQLQAMAQGQLPDSAIAEIDADLAKIK